MTQKLPPHLAAWQLPPKWAWGSDSVAARYRHYQELIDALDRSLSLVSAPDPAHAPWLEAEARHLAHLNHPSIPTTYHYWTPVPGANRGPGYLRHWIAGEPVAQRIRRAGTEDLAGALNLLRTIGSAIAYLHTSGGVHGALSCESCWVTPTGRLYLLGWEWAMPKSEIPPGLSPDRSAMPLPPEWPEETWAPTPASDQWQLAAITFASLTGEYPPTRDVPPITLVRPDVPHSVERVLGRALQPAPEARYHSVSALLRELDRAVGSRTSIFVSGATQAMTPGDSEESRLRWATGEDYEVISRLGSGTFGSVWRVRDLTLGREVALKMLHPEVSSDEAAVRHFRREAQLAASLAHPAIVPVFDFDTNAGVAWYTMELAEGGSLAELVARSGPRTLEEIAPQIENVLDGLAAAHGSGIVHRDLKPENVLIDRYRYWRIGDFGVAKISGEDLLGGTTGTPEFAAPEQLLGEPQGPQVDCFAAAAITYFALTGRAPFGAGDGRAILARELREDVDVSGLAPEAAAWIRRGLAATPDARFPDATEMRDSWRAVADTVLGGGERTPWWRRWLTAEFPVPER